MAKWRRGTGILYSHITITRKKRKQCVHRRIDSIFTSNKLYPLSVFLQKFSVIRWWTSTSRRRSNNKTFAEEKCRYLSASERHLQFWQRWFGSARLHWQVINYFCFSWQTERVSSPAIRFNHWYCIREERATFCINYNRCQFLCVKRNKSSRMMFPLILTPKQAERNVRTWWLIGLITPRFHHIILWSYTCCKVTRP